MNALVITSQLAARIEWNKDIAINEANEIMAKYDGLEFTETQLPEAKKELATLRKVSKEINKQALDIDKELTANVKQFRTEVKEVKAIVDSGISFIDEQVKTFETKQKEDKRTEIMQLVEWEALKHYRSFNEDWLLKKYDVETVRLEIETLANELASQFSTIKMMATSHNMEADKYIEKLKSTPLADVLERIVEDANLTKQVKHEEVVEIEPIVIKTDEAIQTITRKLTGTITQLTMLNEYAKKIGVVWSKTND